MTQSCDRKISIWRKKLRTHAFLETGQANMLAHSLSIFYILLGCNQFQTPISAMLHPFTYTVAVNYTRNSRNNPIPLSRTSDFCHAGSASYFPLFIPMTSSNSSSLRKYCISLNAEALYLKSIRVHAERKGVALQFLDAVHFLVQHIKRIFKFDRCDLRRLEGPSAIPPLPEQWLKIVRWSRVARDHKSN